MSEEAQVQKTVTPGRIAALLLSLGIVAAAVAAAGWTANRVRLIPNALIHLPEISFGAADVRVMLLSAVIACLVTFGAARAIAGWDVYRSGRRVAVEVYALVAGVVAASLYQFFLTAVNFSPEALLQQTLLGIALLLAAFLVFGPRELAAGRKLGSGIGSLFALLKRPLAWVVVLFALTPVIVGRQFAADRDFANWVTKVRVGANAKDDQPFVLVNALGRTAFTTPIMVQFARGDPATAYVLTRGGQLWRADYPSGANARQLLNIAGKVGYVEMENGALGFDLHPEFGRAGSPNAGFVYVYYTQYRPDRQINHLTRYDLRAGAPDRVFASATPLIEQGRKNDGYHNAGMVQFGPDDMLWLSVGEASSAECRQRIDCALYGGILRIDVDQKGGGVSRPILRQPKDGRTANYMVPLDNPWAERGAAALGEYWAIGLRNPFRFAFDPANGQVIAGEVGSTEWEEVNRIVRGGNYQYPYVEGAAPQKRQTKPAQLTGAEQPPLVTYKHTAFLRSVIGGTIYRDAKYPWLRGKYLFGDNYSGEIFAIPADMAGPPRVVMPGDAAAGRAPWQVVARARDVAQRGFTAIVAAPDGELLVPVMGDNDKPTGMIARLAPRGSEAAKQAAEGAKAEEHRLAAAQARNPALAAAAVTPAQARTLFNVNCARCHGAAGQGNGPDAAELGQHIPNFHDENYHRWRSDAAIIAVLNGGGPALGRSALMPPWEGVLRPAEMTAMKDYVRSFRGKPEPEGAASGS